MLLESEKGCEGWPVHGGCHKKSLFSAYTSAHLPYMAVAHQLMRLIRYQVRLMRLMRRLIL